ncbi:MAG: toxin-antitoxin system TumE family protein [Janthinobacterium lividum]
MDSDDEALRRLLDYHRRRYWLVNGWCIRFRVQEAPVTTGRPHGIKYSFTLHDATMTRLLGIDNAHGLPRRQIYDHRHRFRRTEELVPYDYTDADTLIGDFFAAVESAFRQEGVEFSFDDRETELEDKDGEEVSG